MGAWAGGRGGVGLGGCVGWGEMVLGCWLGSSAALACWPPQAQPADPSLLPLSPLPPSSSPPPADSGAKVVVGHQAFGEMALHFLEKYGIMALKIPSKFDLRRFCRATGEPGAGSEGRQAGRGQAGGQGMR